MTNYRRQSDTDARWDAAEQLNSRINAAEQLNSRIRGTPVLGQLATPTPTHTTGGSTGGSKINYGKDAARHHASDFMAELKTICEEKGIDEFLHESTSNSNSNVHSDIVYTLKQNENIGTPHLTFTWSDRTNIYDVVKIHMVNPIKQFNKRINLINNDKWKSKIEESIVKLIEQNTSYAETKTHIESKITELGIKADRIAKFKSFWQIDFKYNDHGRGAIIQYDEKTKEFLFQLRYSDERTVFKMLGQIAGDLNGI